NGGRKLNRDLAGDYWQTVGKRLKEKPTFGALFFKGSLLDKQEAKTMFFVLCVSLSSGEAGGGVLTFVLTLVLMFITTATITEQKPRSTLLPSRRKPGAAPPSSERKALRTQGKDAEINSDLSSFNISRNAKRAFHHVSREATSAK
ncbi:MAG: hypothetical protein RR214_02530, partial [Synergistaceae bacterium]